MDPITEILLPKLEGVRQYGGYWKARCPAHEDREASMTVGRGTSQPVVIRCHAGCDSENILAKIGLAWSDLCEPREESRGRDRGEWTPHGDAIAVYKYEDEDGKLLFQVLRTAGKQFPQRVPDATAKSGWRWSLGSTRRVLYRLPKVIEAVRNGELIYICEGEKDVHAIEAAGMTATCNPGGAGKWREEYSEFLRDAIVIIVADRDKPGQAHARQVAASLEDIAAAVEIREPAGEGIAGGDRIKDVSDHLAAGHGLADLVITWASGDESPVDLAPDLHEFLAGVDEPYDWVVDGILERLDRLVWTGFEGLGKALALDTPIPTPKGWTTMGELSVGDEVFGADGQPARVTMATPVMTGHDCYRVVFSDGAEIIADADHLWLTETLAAREAHQKYARKTGPLQKRGTDQKHKRLHFPAVVTTLQIAETLKARDGHAVNHSVETCQPLQYPAQELPIDPYVLGAWLGDGTSRNSQITSADMEIVAEIRKAGEPCRHLRGYQWSMSDGARGNRSPHTMSARLRALGLIMAKHIPSLYLHASTEQRLALLQGLMDTDGTVAECSGAGRGTGAAVCEFSVTSERLAKDACELMIGLGVKVRFREGRAVLEGRHIGTRYRLSFQTDLPVFRLPRKAERLTPLRTRRAKLRYITAVEPVDSVAVRCIRVDNDDHMFLAGRECIPTHNSVMMRQVAIGAAAGIHPFTSDPITPRKVLWIDCENSERQGRRHFRKLERITVLKGRRVPDGGMRLIHRAEGLDLLSDEDAAWLIERVTAHKPDLLYIGPLTQLHDGDINEERVMRRITTMLNQARVKADCALIIEHHVPHGDGANRSVRPIGSSLLRRWPELGYGIAPAMGGDPCTEVRVLRWRGDRDTRHWPKFLCWGTAKDDWPWVIPPDSVAELEAKTQKKWTPSGAIGGTS
jgi:5S rRNA maturation endonuclease (ribonuclease M5)